MTGKPRTATTRRSTSAVIDSQQTAPRKPWGSRTGALPKYVMEDLNQVYHFLDKQTRQRVGLMMRIPIFIKDPAVALENPALGVQTIEVRLEPGFGDGPTSSRIAVVDFNADTQQVTAPVIWHPENGWFRVSPDGEWLPDAPKEPPEDRKLNSDEQKQYDAYYRQFVEKTVSSQSFHQVNAWAVVQRVLEFYEDPQALGRAVPWGFDGNRLIVVPHAGYGENAFYDRNSKSLQFYYFGDVERPGYTCLSHDIIAHETGHAVLDGIRPLYNHSSAVQTSAFHEFIGDLTAILLALFNRDIRHYLARTTRGDLRAAGVAADLARQFGEVVEGRPYLRSAINDLTMQEVDRSLSPHTVSQVLTGAMFDILIGIARKHMEKNAPEATDEGADRGAGDESAVAAEDTEDAVEAADDTANAGTAPAREVTPYQALWWSAERFRRVALQPLDLCPPCDIQFLDYARAVLLNDILTNPVDEEGYRQDMLEAFHLRGLCTCAYQPGRDLPEGCQFREALDESAHRPKIKLVYPDIERVSRSRTAAYYYLSDNRRALRIPAHQDIVVVDLYDNAKMGVAAERLPREIVLEYLWEEEVALNDDESQGLKFGSYNGKTMVLQCGGTLVFDERGNLLSWFRKPGTEHITPARAQTLRQKSKPSKQDLAELADLDEGERRKAALKEYTARVIQRGLVSEAQAGSPLMGGIKPIAAIEEDGVLRLEVAPHLHDSDFDTEVEGWTVNY
jgi:hypothetical protein